MSYRFRVVQEELSKFPKDGDFIDFIVNEKQVFMVLETVKDFTLCICPLDFYTDDEEFQKLRVPSKVLNLVIDGYIDVTVGQNNVFLKFLDVAQNVVYSYRTPKFASFVDVAYYAGLMGDLSSCDNENLSPIKNLASVASKLGSDLNIYNNVAFCVYNNSYIFQKVRANNCSCDAKRLRKIIDSSMNIKFVSNFIFSRLSPSVVTFSKKTAPKFSRDLDSILGKAYSGIYTVNIGSALAIINGFKFDSTVRIKMNLTTGILSFTTDDMHVESAIRVECSTGVEDLDNLLDGEDAGDVIISLPYWIMSKALNTSKLKIGVSKYAVRIALNGFNIVTTI